MPVAVGYFFVEMLMKAFAMMVTASVLYDLVQCPQRVALDAFGDPADRDQINPFIRLLWERGERCSSAKQLRT